MKRLIKTISVDECLGLRSKVLLPHFKKEELSFETDFIQGGFHLGAFQNHKLVGIASFHPEPYPTKNWENPYRLRQMATDPQHRGQGLGRHLIHFAAQELKQKNCQALWCNARQVAYDFYLKLGFKFMSDEFEVPRVGTHKAMYLILTNEMSASLK